MNEERINTRWKLCCGHIFHPNIQVCSVCRRPKFTEVSYPMRFIGSVLQVHDLHDPHSIMVTVEAFESLSSPFDYGSNKFISMIGFKLSLLITKQGFRLSHKRGILIEPEAVFLFTSHPQDPLMITGIDPAPDGWDSLEMSFAALMAPAMALMLVAGMFAFLDAFLDLMESLRNQPRFASTFLKAIGFWVGMMMVGCAILCVILLSSLTDLILWLG